MAITSYIENGKKVFEVYINGFDSMGRRIQRRKKNLESRRKAETVEFELKRELAQLKEQPVAFRWAEWFDESMRRMKMTNRPSTIWNYEKQIKKWIHPRWEKLELTEISKSVVYTTIFEEMGDRLSDHSRRSILKMVRRLFELAVEEGILDRNPCAGIQVSVAEVDQKVLTSSEVETFLREAKVTGHRFYPIWALALMTGMRSGELFALRWSDTDLEANLISVTRQWTSKNGFGPTKTRRGRVVPISSTLANFLKELKLQSGGSTGDFVLPRLKEWDIGFQAQVTKEFCVSIGITPVKFHDLRATFITNLLARGESLARVMAIVGHTQLKTTNGYLRKAGVEIKGATDKLGYQIPEDIAGARVLTFKRDA